MSVSDLEGNQQWHWTVRRSLAISNYYCPFEMRLLSMYKLIGEVTGEKKMVVLKV